MPFGQSYLADPHATFAKLREKAPIHHIQAPDGSPFWMIVRERDVRAAIAGPRPGLNRARARGGYSGFQLPPALDTNLLNRDGAAHGRIRRHAAAAFTPRRVQSLHSTIQANGRGTREFDRASGTR